MEHKLNKDSFLTFSKLMYDKGYAEFDIACKSLFKNGEVVDEEDLEAVLKGIAENPESLKGFENKVTCNGADFVIFDCFNTKTSSKDIVVYRRDGNRYMFKSLSSNIDLSSYVLNINDNNEFTNFDAVAKLAFDAEKILITGAPPSSIEEKREVVSLTIKAQGLKSELEKLTDVPEKELLSESEEVKEERTKKIVNIFAELMLISQKIQNTE